MAAERRSGTTPLDRLRSHYDDVDLKCPKCGYVDESGKWRVTMTGGRVDYHHLCPSCGARRTRTVRTVDGEPPVADSEPPTTGDESTSE